MKQQIAVIGLDLAKSVFQVHGIGDDGEVITRRKLSRSRLLEYFGRLKPCLVGMEACATAHHWAREIGALGHEVKLMPPQYVKPYVKSQKNDMADAEAICEAVTRPNMRFVPVKTLEQQALLVLHGVRDQWVRLSTRLINTLRGHLAEFGIVAAKGRMGVEAILAVLLNDEDERLPDLARESLIPLAHELGIVKRQIVEADRKIAKVHKASPASRCLETIPGIGPVIATRVIAEVADPGSFKSGRAFSAWIGLVPKQHSSGGRDKLGHITKNPPQDNDTKGLGTDYFDRDWEKIKEHQQITQNLIKDIAANLSDEEISDIEVLFYVGRGGEFGEHYEAMLAETLAKHKKAKSRWESIYHIMTKTSLLNNVIAGLKSVGQPSLASKLQAMWPN
ncbi:IS110 family transposase [Parasphingorhabdus sp.]|uniref:IS110 family transposase n=1 Tax=Parasphingorhabdus sp. TaxID=2709688 RepID=UPI003BAF7FA6